jgi:hypothetical protein
MHAAALSILAMNTDSRNRPDAPRHPLAAIEVTWWIYYIGGGERVEWCGDSRKRLKEQRLREAEAMEKASQS